MPTRIIGTREVGSGAPTYVIGEIGINHNGDLDIAKQLIDIAADSGCDAVKFQKRTPEICVPDDQKSVERDTPWGRMTYLDYRYRVEFEKDDYDQIDAYCNERSIHWFASPWDEPSVDFLEQYEPVCYKVASASLTDDGLLRKLTATERPLIISTGMSSMEQIEHAVGIVGEENLLVAHATSAYPCAPEELNLRMIHTLQGMYPEVPVGYSGHETGLQTTLAAVSLGATFVERHITVDRAMWGSDQSASLEPGGLERLVRDVRIIESAMGDGVKRVYDSEIPIREKLRRVG